MIEVNLSRLSSEATTLLMLRGTAPSLSWQERPNQGAKAILDQIDNAKLLGVRELKSEAMAVAVRALLYLWNGWIAECVKHAQGTEEKESLYISGFALRASGQPEQAKKLFQRLGPHPVCERMLTHFLQTVGSSRDLAIKRVRETAELGQAWEPFAFIDLCEQARTGKLSPERAQLVTQLQRKEFELLFCHCYEGATGVDLAKPDAPDTAKRPRKIERKQKHHVPHQPDTGSAPSGSGARADNGKKAAHPITPINVSCPKCRTRLAFPGSAVGKQAKCVKCGTVFTVVPQGETAAR